MATLDAVIAASWALIALINMLTPGRREVGVYAFVLAVTYIRLATGA